MKVFDVVDNRIHCEYPQFSDLEQAYRSYPRTVTMVEAPDWVREGFGYDPSKEGDERFIRPELSEGWVWNDNGNPWNPEETRISERTRLHAETTNDTLQALRKIREGDQTIDWSAWLDQLDAYNLAIEATKEQEGYPLKVTYPEYPTKPTAAGGGGS